MTTLYQIRDWRKHFEKNRSHGSRTPSHVSIPNRLDGAAYAELVQGHEEGPAHFGAWVVLLEVASVCNPRGTLVRSNGLPHDTLSLSRVTKFPERILTDALQRLVTLGWIEVSEANGTTRTARARMGEPVEAEDAQTGQADTIGSSCISDPLNRKTLNTGKTEELIPRMVFPVLGGVSWKLLESKASEYESTYLGVDVNAELRKALQWLRDNPRNVKTPQGMPRFLNNWLARAQNSAHRVGGVQQKRDGMSKLLEIQAAKAARGTDA